MDKQHLNVLLHSWSRCSHSTLVLLFQLFRPGEFREFVVWVRDCIKHKFPEVR